MYKLALIAVFLWGSAVAASPVTSGPEKPNPSAAQPLPQIKKLPAESWVIEHQTPSITPAHRLLAKNGELNLLVDRQVIWAKGGYDEYKRNMIEVTDRSGLEDAAQIQRDFDPSIGTLVLNHLRIWRDGKIIDHLKDTELTVLRREGQLNDGVIDGNLTATMQLKDVRVGDIVDFAWTRKITKSLWPNHDFLYIPTQWSAPIGAYYFRLSWPSQYPMIQKSFKTNEAINSHKEGENTIYELTIHDSDPVTAESNVPSWFPQWGNIELSTMASWGEVVNWALPLYNLDLSLPPDYAKKINAIGLRFHKPEDRATEILRLVQDEVRYVGDELGEGSYKPREPAKVIKSGYGDCKDKSLLLVAALRSLGIKADVALANPTYGNGIDNYLPAPTVFNHAIVRVEINGAVYWLDPTLSHQGGRLPNIAVPDYGYVLPLAKPASRLERIMVPAPSAPLTKAIEVFEVSENNPLAVTLDARTEWRGRMADYERALYAKNSPEDLSRHNLNYYAKYYPGIQAAQPNKVEDNRDENLVILTEKYTLNREAFNTAKLNDKFPLRADAVMNFLPTPSANQRHNPLYIPPGLYAIHEIHLTLASRVMNVSNNINRKVGPVSFTEKWSTDSPTAVIQFTIRTDVDPTSVSAADAASVIKLAHEINAESDLSLNIDKLEKKPAIRFKISQAAIAPYEKDLMEISTLIGLKDEAKYIEALGKIDVLQKKVPPKTDVSGLIGTFKATALLGLNRKEAALIELDEALKYYHGMSAFNYLQAALKADKKDFPGATVALTDLANQHPENVNLITKSLLQYVLQNLVEDKSDNTREIRFQFMLSLARANYTNEGEWEPNQGILTAAIKGLIEHGQINDARKMAEKLNNVGNIGGLLIDRRYASLWPSLEKRAGTGLHKIIDREIEITNKELNNFPKDLALRLKYIRLLRISGRNEEAIKADDGLLTDMSRVEALGPDAFWLVNDLGYTLYASGQRSEALEIFANLKKLGVERYPSLVSMNINYTSLKLENGDFAGALADADSMLGPDAPPMSPYGKAFVRSVRSCALRELGHPVEADKELEIVAEAAKDNMQALSYTLACAGDGDRLEKQLQTMLEDKDYRSGVILMVQKFAKPDKLTPFEQKYQNLLLEVLHRPALMAKIKQSGRVVNLPGSGTAWGAF